MVKIALTISNGRRVLILGLSSGDLANLVGHRPHAFPGEQIGLNELDVYVTYGATDDDILAALKRKGMVPPDTQPEKPT